MKNLLFICTINFNRSPTAEALFKNSKKYRAKSAGTGIIAAKKVTASAIKWADIIFCMEKDHKDFILEKFPKQTKDKEIHVLNIPDIYIRGEPQLVETLKKKLKRWL